MEQTIQIKRMLIAEQYCTSKGWPTKPEDLTFEQILEIRALESWKNAGNPENNKHEGSDQFITTKT